jgi:alkylation response protein AidB-like acyl-CoA dehydrogenase
MTRAAKINLGFSEEQNILRDSVRAQMNAIATPEYCRKLDREQSYPYELYDAWVKMGLLQLPFPEQYGGLGGGPIDIAIVAEELSRKSFDIFTAYSNCVFCGLNVARNGTEAQRRYWLPRIMAGETKMSVSMSEPGAGSDVGAMRTRAVRDGSHWVINGQKLWATGAGAKGNVINLYAKTDPQAHYKRGISLFLVDNDTPGLKLRKLDMLGRRGVGTYEIFFDDVRVPADRLIGEENNGWSCVLSGLQVERMTVAAGYVGNLEAVFELALNYAKERKQFGQPIGSFQAIAHMLADMQTEIAAARMLTLQAAWMLESGINALREITMAKLFASEAHVRIVNQGMQIFGAYGYNMEYDMQRHFRDARASTVGAGSSQMQRNLLANLMGLKVK